MAAQSFQYLAGALLLLGLSTMISTVQSAEPPGDLWKTSSQMSMEGADMKMPVQTSQVCAPKEWTQPPAGANPQQNCQNSDFTKEGDKVTWKITCADAAHTTGEGEITREGSDAYTGSIKFTSDRGNMTLALTGSRIDGCDNPGM